MILFCSFVRQVSVYVCVFFQFFLFLHNFLWFRCDFIAATYSLETSVECFCRFCNWKLMSCSIIEFAVNHRHTAIVWPGYMCVCVCELEIVYFCNMLGPITKEFCWFYSLSPSFRGGGVISLQFDVFFFHMMYSSNIYFQFKRINHMAKEIITIKTIRLSRWHALCLNYIVDSISA